MENIPKPRKKIKVLAVDDTPSNLVALEAVLSRDYELVLAHSGAEAVELLSKPNDISVILLDIQMPDMDGFECASAIKRLDHCKEIPIIFITAIYKEEPFVKRGYQLGAVDYFSKPFDPEILKMKVDIYASFRQKSAILREREMQIVESEELLKAGRKLSTVLESLPVGVLIADVQGRICQSNEVVARILKTTALTEGDRYGAILGWWQSDGQMIKNHDGPLQRALHNGESSHNVLLPVTCVDGTEKKILASASPLRAEDHHIVGAVVVLQDMTEPKRIEMELQSRITKLISLGVEIEHRVGH